MLSKRLFMTFLLALLFSTVVAFSATAKQLNVNRDFGEIHMVAVPNEFSIVIPDTEARASFPPSVTTPNTYMHIEFLTASGQVKENLLLGYLRIPLLPENDRLLSSTKLLTESFEELVGTSPQSKSLKVIAGYQATVLMATHNQLCVVLLAFINSASHHTITALLTADPVLSAAKSPDALLTDSAAIKVLETFKYGRELM